MKTLPKTHWHGGLPRSGKRTAIMTCPDCGQEYSLGGYEIDDKGVVTPSVVCVTKGCTFHEHLILEGWSAVPRRP